MVEFGVKLEDNKVSEWGDKYIRYEKLKNILKKAGDAVKQYDNLASRRPETAERVTQEYREGLPTPSGSRNQLAPSSSEHGSGASGSRRGSFSSLRSIGSNVSLEASDTAAANNADSANEQSRLVHSSSMRSYTSTSSPGRGNALTRALESATSGVSDYFYRSYERQVRDSLKLIDKYSHEFEKCLLEDIEKVNNFYTTSLNEDQGRLQLLKESVAQSFSNRHTTRSTNNNMISPPPPPPHPHHRSLGNRGSSSLSADQHQCDSSAGGGSSVGGGGVEDGDSAAPASQSNSHDNEDNDDYLTTPLVQNTKKGQRNNIAHQAVVKIRRTIYRHHHRRESSNGAEGVNLPLVSEGYGENDPETTTTTVAENPVEADRRAREVDSIQRSLVDLYRQTKLLHNYAIMNYTGFVKIVKKHDKTLTELKGKYKQLIRPASICNEGKDVEKLAERIERLYANWFCDRSVNEARIQLLPKKGDGLETDWSQLRLGYRMGMCSILGLWVCWDCIWGMLSTGSSTIGGRTAFPIFRACGGLLWLQWLWGCSVWVWTRYRVNYIFLFDFNPNIVASPLAIFNEAVDNSLVFLFGMLLYYKAGVHDIPGSFPAGVFPAALVAYTVYKLIFPLRIRGEMWHSIWLVVTAPMTSPSFFHGYIGDIFTSMVKVFQDMAWSLGFLISGDWLIPEDSTASTRHLWSKSIWYSKCLIPLLTLLPLWFRFNQCLRRYTDTGKRWPHLANAFKYALSMTVTLFGAFHPLYLERYADATNMFQFFWMATFVSSSLYSFFWDVCVDWGLGRPQFNFLGPRLMYPNRPYYYMIIAIDLVLRFAWVLTLVPPNSGASFALPAYLTAVSMMLELFRRTLWGFLRLENEHRSNTSGYRRVGFVPLHFRTEHSHGYKKEEEHRGISVLAEVAAVTVVVLAAAVASVVAAQHETERLGKFN